MKHRTDEHDVFAELAAGHALYALEPGDEQIFLAHLSGCAACERDVEEHRETLNHLAYAAVDHEPPPALLEGIRAGVRESGRGSTDPEALAGAASLDQARSRRERRRADVPRMRRAATWLGAAAAFALVASLAVWNTALQRDNDVNADFPRLVQALEGENTETVALRSEDGEVLAVAVVNGRRMSLVVDGLEPNDADATSYVLWGRNSLGGVRAVSTFDIDRSEAEVLDEVPLDDEMDAFMVTHEKGNTAPPVSTQPVLAIGEI